ncbi:thioredoxin reductase (NADPH) [Glutamicibacter mysorens]|uniref:Thioredoxin reductase n=1 Tax=Glutamicibacter mysorens TaxID=257984 RepID=A0ABX4N1U2_9MICC|nr:thioredoxin reductase (NADPH) [Glutamicibacter mysorens]
MRLDLATHLALIERKGSTPVTSAQNDEIRDVIIVGSGPAGYTAAVYTARANLNPLVIAGSVTAGGELMNTTDVENFPGFPEGIMGPDLMDNMQKQAERFGAEILFDDVTEMNLEGEIKTLSLADGTVYRARAVIVSTGSAYRELGLEDEKRLSGHGVSWCATCDGFFFREQTIAVIGGGDSAMEEALFLTKFASKVIVVHRRNELRASKIMADRALAHEKIEFIWDSEVVGINGAEKVEGLVVKNRTSGEETTVDVTGIFVAIGNDPRVDLVKDQLELTSEGTIAVEGRSSKTSLPGVFAAGDVIDSTYRQAITAAGSGCAAAQDVEHYLANVSETLATA